MTKTNKPHVHAEVIKAWADGKPVEWRESPMLSWQLIANPGFIKDYEYRIKPEEVVDYALVYDNGIVASQFCPNLNNVHLTARACHYDFRQGFIKRTRIDGKIISFEFISK